jgi:hypothetical protein
METDGLAGVKGLCLDVGVKKAPPNLSNDREKPPLDESDFEGTLVLEKLAAIDKVDDFLEAVDSDDFATAKRLMKAAKVDRATIKIVLRKMGEADGEH